jgi:peptide/nickel transport system substrate-binding protein
MKRLLAILVCLALVAAAGAAAAQVKNPDMFILAHSNTTITLDPGTCYSSTAWAKIMNIYEPLVFFDGSSTEKYKPVLAAEVPSKANGGISEDGKTYSFPIRKGVKFQNGADLTPEDVEYTFERALIIDQNGGPTWMLLEALFGIGSTRGKDGKMLPGLAQKIDEAIQVKDGKVIFKLHKPFPPFLALVAFANGLIIDKDWAIAQGCWDGDMANAAKYNNPTIGQEPLHKVANGTGPYRLKDWQPNISMTFERNPGYWGKKPAIKTAVVKIVKEWSTRKLMLQNGDVDRANVDAPYIPEVKDMKDLSSSTSPPSSACTPAFQPEYPGRRQSLHRQRQAGRQGHTADFFSDLNVRKAFAHCFDRATYKEDVFNGRVILPTSPVIKGLPYHKDVPVHEFDLEKAAEIHEKGLGRPGLGQGIQDEHHLLHGQGHPGGGGQHTGREREFP